MKIAVIGKGTAGTIASAYLKDNVINSEVDLYYTDEIKTIGVGEGGGPRLKKFIETLSIDENKFMEETSATKKWGILFENWGKQKKKSVHHFSPPKKGYSYHFDANKLQDLIIKNKGISTYNYKIENINNNSSSNKVEISIGGKTKEYDYLVDASGFNNKDKANENKIEKKLLICNEALLIQTDNKKNKKIQYSCSGRVYNSLTISKAMKYGWLFVIPLQTRISYGYIYSSDHCKKEEIKREIIREIEEREKSPNYMAERDINFRTFSKGQFCYKKVFAVGNRAAFAEPLEATAIEFILRECEEIEQYLNEKEEYKNKREQEKEQIFNNNLDKEMERIALFIGWHYSNGSVYKTSFWDEAKNHYKEMRANIISPDINKEFDDWMANVNYIGAKPESPFFGWSFNSFEEVKKAIK